MGTARDHLIELKPDILAGAYKLIFGHMTRRDVIYSLNGADKVRFAAMIREPVARFISEYAYATSAKHPDHADVIERYPSLEAFVEQCVDANVLTHYLERYRGQPVEDIVYEVENEFCFLGQVEQINEDMPALIRLFSTKQINLEHLNKGNLEISQVPKDTINRIRELNARDVEFYNILINRKTASANENFPRFV